MCSESAKDPDRYRRWLLGAIGAAGGFVGFRGMRLLYAQAPPSTASHPGFSPPHVFPNEPLARSLGYTEDASKVDKAKFANYKAGETCSNCRFFTGPAGKPFGPCQIFSGKLVSATGWCASYNAKT